MQAKTQNEAPCALITGAAKRIGAEIAKAFHAAGYNVIIHYRRSKKEAVALCQALNQARAQSAKALQADLADHSQIQSLCDETMHLWGRLDVLINNASSYYPTPVSDCDEAQWDDLFASNAKAPLFLAKYLHPQLEKHKGAIINIADIHGIKPMSRHTIYSMAKASLIMLTKSLAKEFAPLVRVNAVAPGPILWPTEQADLDEDRKQQILSRIALERIGTPEEVTKAVLFLARDATYTTGHTLALDGGRVEL